MSSIRSIKSTSLLSVAIDSNQLLSTCQSIKENMDKLDKSISLVQLRLTTLSYVGKLAGDDFSLKCSDDLIELCGISQLLVQQLDELNSKLSESAASSISYQIASQQLMFFTGEWYDNLTPKFNETFEMAEKLDPNLSMKHLKASLAITKSAPGQTKRTDTKISTTEVRVRDALLRLKQSMIENERLIATIANNIEYTKATIEAIYDSLQSTKFGLDVSEQNTIESIKIVRQSNRYRLIIVLVLLAVFVVIIYMIFRFLGLI